MRRRALNVDVRKRGGVDVSWRDFGGGLWSSCAGEVVDHGWDCN